MGCNAPAKQYCSADRLALVVCLVDLCGTNMLLAGLHFAGSPITSLASYHGRYIRGLACRPRYIHRSSDRSGCKQIVALLLRPVAALPRPGGSQPALFFLIIGSAFVVAHCQCRRVC